MNPQNWEGTRPWLCKGKLGCWEFVLWLICCLSVCRRNESRTFTFIRSCCLDYSSWLHVRERRGCVRNNILMGDFVVQMPAHQKQDFGHQQTLPGFLNSFAVTPHFFAAVKNLNYTAFIGIQSPKVMKSLCISTLS